MIDIDDSIIFTNLQSFLFLFKYIMFSPKAEVLKVHEYILLINYYKPNFKKYTT